jgi:hypothetical protein
MDSKEVKVTHSCGHDVLHTFDVFGILEARGRRS